MRKDLPELAMYARDKGMRTVISTNGTLIDEKMAKVLKDIGLSYVGVSLDGIRETNDMFRGVPGAFDAALQGMRNCKKEGIKVGLRFTINKKNAQDIPAIFDLLEEEGIPGSVSNTWSTRAGVRNWWKKTCPMKSAAV